MRWPDRIKKALARYGVTDEMMALGALLVSIEDLRRELRRSRKSQRELHDPDDLDIDPED